MTVSDDRGGLDEAALAVALSAARAADAKHGTDVTVLAVGDVLAITEYFVICGAGNRRLVRTLVEEVEAEVGRELQRRPLRTEGRHEQQWVLLDYGDVVVHVFLQEIRDFYEIERLYRDVAVIDWTAVDH
ncbi:MAG: ribosome silencing factor [Acidimicrobiia bacterium]|jgi:ribosome-associated protein|nr:ribosome silencing factor [Acidimicrobiia bacterium]MBA3983593.1 ribosome silencing factor [Acidimicrobiia bacterium]MDQ3391927.1 ribosome silencing factor [Actinomycetota bacterium]